MHEDLRHRLLGGWARWVCRHPWAVLAASALLTVLSLWLAVTGLTFMPDRNDLLSPELPWNQRFIEWTKRFEGLNDLVIVVDAADAPAARGLVDELASRLRQHPRVTQVTHGYDTGEVSPRAARLLPWEAFEARLLQARQAQALLEAPSAQAMLQGVGAALRREAQQDAAALPEQLDGLARLIAALGGEEAQAPTDGWRYLESENGRLLFVRLRVVYQGRSLDDLKASIDAVRAVMDGLRPAFATVPFGLTGVKALEADETAVAMRDTTLATVIATVLLMGLMVVAYHSVRVPLLCMVALLVGVAWSFGLAELLVGHLQVISVTFAVMLLGLGIAFGIHIVSRFELVRHRQAWPSEEAGFVAAMTDSLETVGPGVITGAVTTAAAFMTTLLTPMRGMGEMGLIAGAGVMACLVAMFTTLPALMRIFLLHEDRVSPFDGRWLHLYEPRWSMPFVRRPRLTAMATLIVLGASLLTLPAMRFDGDLTRVQPTRPQSIQWQQRIVDLGGRSVWYAVSVAPDFEAAVGRADALRALPTVAGLGGVGVLLPADLNHRMQRIAQTRAALPALDALPADEPTDLDAVRTHLRAMSLAVEAGLAAAPSELRQSLIALRNQVTHTLKRLEHASAQSVGTAYQQLRHHAADQLRAMLDPAPVTPRDLPPALLASFVAADGAVALEVYPRLAPGQSALDGEMVPAFTQQVRMVDDQATGPLIQVYESGQLMRRAYARAGLYALAVVFLLVLIDFQNLTAAALSLLPVVVGFAVCFAVIHGLGMAVNPANVIVLPLMFGIGVDAGVHVLHRYRVNSDERPLGMTDGTGKGVTITSLTVVIGFGSMVFAEHRGVASLGLVMAVGILLTMLVCWIVMPAVLELKTTRRERT